MGWLGLSIFFSLGTIAILYLQNRKLGTHNKDEYIIGGVMSLFLSLFIVGLVGGLYTGTKEGRDITAEGCYESVNAWNIVSAVRDKEFNSSFILGTGGGSTVDRYYVYQVEPGGMMLTNFYADRTFVVEQDGQPRYERIDTICPRPIADFLWWSDNHVKHNFNRNGTLYVPKNTILREFRM